MKKLKKIFFKKKFKYEKNVLCFLNLLIVSSMANANRYIEPDYSDAPTSGGGSSNGIWFGLILLGIIALGTLIFKDEGETLFCLGLIAIVLLIFVALIYQGKYISALEFLGVIALIVWYLTKK